VADDDLPSWFWAIFLAPLLLACPCASIYALTIVILWIDGETIPTADIQSLKIIRVWEYKSESGDVIRMVVVELSYTYNDKQYYTAVFCFRQERFLESSEMKSYVCIPNTQIYAC
jgi:hypothetical protein